MERFFREMVLSVIFFVRRFFMRSTYVIKKVLLEYKTTGDNFVSDSIFWKNERRFWNMDSEWTMEPEDVSTDITWIYKNRIQIDPPPSCVSDITYRVTYMYAGTIYTFVTRNPNHAWPPKKVPGFNPAIKEAWITMFDDFQDDATKRVKQFAGPNSDFHGETLHLRDMFNEQCVSLRLVNMLGKSTTITNSVSRFTLWT
jgi:hypothetical protein